jgi:hypothetical protein
MITAFVQYRLPPGIDLTACAEHFRKIAPSFRRVPGLIRKQFIYAEDGWAGGVYLSKTRADAEAFYSGPWLAGIRERYGMDPQITPFGYQPCRQGALSLSVGQLAVIRVVHGTEWTALESISYAVPEFGELRRPSIRTVLGLPFDPSAVVIFPPAGPVI